MKAKLERDRQRRMVVLSNELRRRRYKALLKQVETRGSVREEVEKRFDKISRDGSPTRVQNRCVFTGRARGVSRLFRMSRMQAQKLVRQGKIPGLRKASW